MYLRLLQCRNGIDRYKAKYGKVFIHSIDFISECSIRQGQICDINAKMTSSRTECSLMEFDGKKFRLP